MPAAFGCLTSHGWRMGRIFPLRFFGLRPLAGWPAGSRLSNCFFSRASYSATAFGGAINCW